ncbi:MAG: VIT domain-containing protein, partial [Planctomycetota bacterium]
MIARPKVQHVAVEAEGPGCGAMLAKLPTKEKEIPLPLKHTDVKGRISGYVATVEVTQQFHNPYDEKIEAVYVFPLPQNAAINEFIMTIGERKIRGIIR